MIRAYLWMKYLFIFLFLSNEEVLENIPSGDKMEKVDNQNHLNDRFIKHKYKKLHPNHQKM